MEVRGRQRGSARWTIRYRDWKSRVCWSCYWGRQMVSDSCLYDCCSPRQSDSFLRAAASCPVFPRLTNRTAGQLSPFLPPRYTAAPDASPSCLCLIFLFNIHIVMIVECAVRLLSSIAWKAELGAYGAWLYCQIHARRVQASSSLSPMPPLITGLHFPHTSKSRAGLLTASTALIQHIEMPHKSGLGTTSLMPAWSSGRLGMR